MIRAMKRKQKLTKRNEIVKQSGLANIAFTCSYMLNDLESCLSILQESNRLPEGSCVVLKPPID